MSLGIHIAKDSKIRSIKFKSMLDAIKRETELLSLSAAQIFTHGPRSRSKNAMDYKKIREYCDDNKIDISVHGSYVSVGIWTTNDTSHIYDMLESTQKLGAHGLVLHLPKKSASVVVKTMEILSDDKKIQALEKYGKIPLILLEMPASRPDANTYETPQKLNNLVHLLETNRKVTIDWGLVIDTAHQYSCGVSFEKPNSWNEWSAELSNSTQKRIKTIHLNGADFKNFNTGKDVHIIAMSNEDAIWGDLISSDMHAFIKDNTADLIKEENNLFEHLSSEEQQTIKNSSLFGIVQFAKSHEVAIIMEINRGDFIDAKLAADVINGLLRT